MTDFSAVLPYVSDFTVRGIPLIGEPGNAEKRLRCANIAVLCKSI